MSKDWRKTQRNLYEYLILSVHWHPKTNSKTNFFESDEAFCSIWEKTFSLAFLLTLLRIKIIYFFKQKAILNNVVIAFQTFYWIQISEYLLGERMWFERTDWQNIIARFTF